MSSNNYVVLNPYVFDPHFTPEDLSVVRLHPTHITADAPVFPMPSYARTTINSHLTTLTLSTAATAPAAPHDYESETEILVLDADILERHPTTHVIGECGRRGCRITYGCIACTGEFAGRGCWDRSLDPTPRTHFRNAVAMALGEEGAVAVMGEGRAEGRGGGYPTHLQRFEEPVTVKRGRRGGGGVGQGPRIKYCKRRAGVEPKGDDTAAVESEEAIVVKKPHKSKAQLAALERKRRAPVRKKG